MYNVGMLIYAAIQYDQINRVVKKLIEVDYLDSATTVWTDIQPYLLVVPIVIAVFTVILSFIAWKLYDEFAWTIYKHISADLRMKRRFLNFQVSTYSLVHEHELTVLGLHRTPQIRFLLLSRIHCPVSGHRYRSGPCRNGSYDCRGTHHHSHLVHGSILDPT